MIELKCRGCGQVLKLPDSAAGKHARCRKCGAVTPVPPSGPPHIKPADRAAEPIELSLEPVVPGAPQMSAAPAGAPGHEAARPARMVESKRRRYLKLVLIGGGVLLVGGIGVVVYLLWPPNLDDTTPVGAFNKHIDARYRRDWETAISCLSDRQCRIRAEEVRSKILRGGTPGLTRQDLALPDRQLLVRDEARFDEKGMAKDIERGRIEWDLTKGSVENPPLKEFKILSAVTRGDRCVITYQRPGFVEGYNLRMAMIREGRRWFVEGFVFDDLGAVPEAAAPTATTTPHP